MRSRPTRPQPYLTANTGVGGGGGGVQAQAGMVLAGRYGLVEPIAAGGMAQVWLGDDMALVRRVAIKILHPHLAVDQGFVTRFRREAVASARLSHPSIVAVYDTVSEAGIEAIVMELIDGRTLRAVLDEVSVLPPGDVIDVGMQISDALDEAHRAGIVHRDIKPANIMVSTDRRILVTDFGIAKANKDADLTHTGTLLGTAKYLAPEQVAGESVDPRADIYSLGIVLFEAATGFPPFLAENDAGTALARLQGEVPRCRHRRSSVPVGLDEVIARSMARSPHDRFDRAANFRVALAAVDPTNVRIDTSDLGPALGNSAGLSSGVTTVAAPGSSGAAPPNGAATPLPAQPPVGHSGTAVLPQGAFPIDAAPAVPTGRKAKKSAKRSAKKQAKQTGKRPPSRPPGGRMPIDGKQRPTKTFAAVLIVVGLVVAGLLVVALVAGNGGGASGNTPTIVSAIPFDPLGGGRELNDLAPLAIDGDTTTKWRTETYDLARLSGLKDGVGLTLELADPAELREIEFTTNTEGWEAEIYVADEPFGPDDGGFSTDELGGPAAVIEGGGRAETVTLDGASGSHVLIWLTEAGKTESVKGFRFELFEVAVR